MIHLRQRYALSRLCCCLALITALALGGASASIAGTRATERTRHKYVIDVFQGQLVQPMLSYRTYENGLLTQLNGQLSTLLAAERAGNLAAAEATWLPAHLSWLEIGQDDGAYGAFGPLGSQIDGLADGHVGGTASPDFTGFHRIEFELWTKGDTSAAALATVALQALVARLQRIGMARELPLSVSSLSAWVLRCHEILEDADRDSLTAYDNYGSGSDIASVSADVSATREMLFVLAPVIRPRAPHLLAVARAQLRALERAAQATLIDGQWVAVAALPEAQRERIDAAAGAALETLAPVSDLIHVAGDNT
jgi:iron uptake system EfeUOB component EfeO/EfeM